MTKQLLILVMPLLLCFPSAVAVAQIDPCIEASRVMGVAPLAVFLDASGTTATSTNKPFHELQYSWDFGDSGCGTWLTGNSDKNRAYGPVTGHVFESSGTYTVTLTVRDSLDIASSEVAITVEKPDNVFSGTNTICFSSGGDFTGAPDGALLITTGSFTEIVGYMEGGKRLLLCRGESWSAGPTGHLNLGGPGILGAFGPGIDQDGYGIYANNPVLTGARFSLSGGIQFDPETVNTYDWRFMDLVFIGTESNPVFGAEGEIDNVLFFRTTIEDCYMAMSFAGTVLDYYNHHYGQSWEPFYGISVVQCRLSDFYLAPMYADLRDALILGNNLSDSETSHVTRFPYLGGAVISHNYMTLPRTTGHLIKLHGPPWAGDWLYAPGTYSERIVISENHFDGSIEDWPVAIAPQNSASDEYIRDVIVENNYFTCTSEQAAALYLSCYETTVRNNLFNGVDVLPWRRSIIATNRNPGMPVPTGFSIVNNTFSTQGGYFVVMDLTGADFRVKNNLAYAPDAGELGGIGDASFNLLTAECPFSLTEPGAPDEFIPHSESGAVDTGTPVRSWSDFFGHPTPSGEGWDLGAIEVSSMLWEVAVSIETGALSIEWGELPGGDSVLVFREAAAYFDPDTVGYSNRIAVVPFAEHGFASDYGIGSEDSDVFYQLIARDTGEREVCRSRVVGAKDYLTSGNAPVSSGGEFLK